MVSVKASAENLVDWLVLPSVLHTSYYVVLTEGVPAAILHPRMIGRLWTVDQYNRQAWVPGRYKETIPTISGLREKTTADVFKH